MLSSLKSANIDSAECKFNENKTIIGQSTKGFIKYPSRANKMQLGGVCQQWRGVLSINSGGSINSNGTHTCAMSFERNKKAPREKAVQ